MNDPIVTADGKKIAVTAANGNLPRFKFDFDKLKRKERTEFGDDLQKAVNFKEAGLTADQADRLVLKWMARLIVEWPDGRDFSDPVIFEDLTALEWKEATTAFMSQFRIAFEVEESGS